jgi:hypothetical protein
MTNPRPQDVPGLHAQLALDELLAKERAQLARDLHLTLVRAGHPTLRELAARTEKLGFSISSSTLSRIFNAQSWPTWDQVRTILIALDANPRMIDSWKRQLMKLSELRAQKHRPELTATPLYPLEPSFRTEAIGGRHTPTPDPMTDSAVHTMFSAQASRMMADGTWAVCRGCGAVVADQEAHSSWHADLGTSFTRRRYPTR